MTPAFAPSASPVAARGRWIPWIFVAAMLGVVAVNAILIYFAVSSFGGVVTTRAFERGIAYNRLIAAAAAEEALGWKADVAYQADPYRSGRLVVTLHGADGRPIDRAIVAVEAQRPLESDAPIVVAMRGEGEGRYAGAVDELRAGQWDVRMTVARDGSAAHFTQRIVVR
jgi:nitrogen fixation protein FixH